MKAIAYNNFNECRLVKYKLYHLMENISIVCGFKTI